jgi:hypothetical protein
MEVVHALVIVQKHIGIEDKDLAVFFLFSWHKSPSIALPLQVDVVSKLGLFIPSAR